MALAFSPTCRENSHPEALALTRAAGKCSPLLQLAIEALENLALLKVFRVVLMVFIGFYRVFPKVSGVFW